MSSGSTAALAVSAITGAASLFDQAAPSAFGHVMPLPPGALAGLSAVFGAFGIGALISE